MDEDQYSEVYKQARGIAPKSARALESQLLRSPDDIATRVKLLGYYRDRKGAASRWTAHLVAAIDRSPTLAIFSFCGIHQECTPEHITSIRTAWKTAIKRSGSNFAVKYNAALCLQLRDPPFAIRTLESLIRNDPRRTDVLMTLAYLYCARARVGGKAQTAALTKAFKSVDKVLKRKLELGDRQGMVAVACDLALSARDESRASKYCRLLEAMANQFGYFKQSTYNRLGRLALLHGDSTQARRYFDRFCKMGYSRNLTLAAELYQAGHEKFVLRRLDRLSENAHQRDYINSCVKSWAHG